MAGDTAPAPLSAAVGGSMFLDASTDLRLSAFNSAAGVTLTVTTLLMGLDGHVQRISETHVPNTNRTVSSKMIPMGVGWLLSAQIVASGGTPRRGQCFARLELVKGLGTSFVSMGTPLQGYVQDTTALAFPGSPIHASSYGPGVIRSIGGTDPAAGVEITETVPTNARWRLISMVASLACSGVAANRNVQIVVDDGTTNMFISDAISSSVAGNTRTYTFVSGLNPVAIFQNNVQVALPPLLMMMGGSRIRTGTTGLDVGDNWSAPQLLVEEWIED